MTVVSVLMPAYRMAPYIGQAIESILGQTMGDFELIVIDDGSDDDTADIARSFDDPRITVLRNDTNLGIGTSLNRALALATAPFVTRQDADDISTPDRLVRQVECLHGRPDADICSTWAIRFGSAEGQVYGARSDAEARAWVLFHSPIIGPSAMIRRSSLDANGLRFRAGLSFGEDYDLWALCVRHGLRFVDLPEPVYRLRVRAGSASHAGQQLRDQTHAEIRRPLLDLYFPTMSPLLREAVLAALSTVGARSRPENEAALVALALMWADPPSRLGLDVGQFRMKVEQAFAHTMNAALRLGRLQPLHVRELLGRHPTLMRLAARTLDSLQPADRDRSAKGGSTGVSIQ